MAKLNFYLLGLFLLYLPKIKSEDMDLWEFEEEIFETAKTISYVLFEMKNIDDIEENHLEKEIVDRAVELIFNYDTSLSEIKGTNKEILEEILNSFEDKVLFMSGKINELIEKILSSPGIKNSMKGKIEKEVRKNVKNISLMQLKRREQDRKKEIEKQKEEDDKKKDAKKKDRKKGKGKTDSKSKGKLKDKKDKKEKEKPQFTSTIAFLKNVFAKANKKLIKKIDESENPVASVILTYDKEYFKPALRSIQLQKQKEIEIIIVDPKSTEESSEEIQKETENDKRIKVLPFGDELSLEQRTKAIKQATGKYVFFLDKGTVFCQKTALSYAVERMEMHNSDYLHFQVLVGDFRKEGDLGLYSLSRPVLAKKEAVEQPKLAGYLGRKLSKQLVFDKVYLRSNFEKNGFKQLNYKDPKMAIADDSLFTMFYSKVAKKYKTHYLSILWYAKPDSEEYVPREQKEKTLENLYDNIFLSYNLSGNNKDEKGMFGHNIRRISLSSNSRTINIMEKEKAKKYIDLCRKFINNTYTETSKKRFQKFCDEIGY